MENTTTHYRLFLNEKLRKHLGVNLKKKKIFIFKVNHKTYLSTTSIPRSGKYETLEVILGNVCWFIDIPNTYLEYEPTNFKLLNTRGKVIEII